MAVTFVNLIVDPVRVFSSDYDKSANALRASSPEFLSMKMLSGKYRYALIGSSRNLPVDVRFIHQELGQDCINLGLGDASFYDFLIVAREVKKRGKHFVCGLDAFSLNSVRYQGRMYEAKREKIRRSMEEGYSNLIFYMSTEMLRLSWDTIRIRLLGRSYNERLDEIDRTNHPFSEERISLYFNNDKNLRYSNYTPPSDESLQELATLADDEDIFVIYPKHSLWYKHFCINGVDAKYFGAVSKIVKQTRGKVICFYGIYPLTEDRSNFDRDGWHFKPKLSRLIFQRIFDRNTGSEETEFGCLLTSENVDSRLAALRSKLMYDFALDGTPTGLDMRASHMSRKAAEQSPR